MATVTLQSEIDAEERAIRHLIGEHRSLTSATHRLEARMKLERARLGQLELAALVTPPPPQHPNIPVVKPIPHGMRFVDVSAYQPRVNLDDVRHAVELTEVSKSPTSDLFITKATEGLDYVDGYLGSRWHGAYLAGFPHRGAYHFLHPSESGKEQAEHFLEALHASGNIRAQDIVVCDAEVSDGQSAGTVANCVGEFGTTLAKECPAKRWLYGGGPFAKEFGLVLAPYQAHWLAAYVTDPTPYYAFGKPLAWQFTGNGLGPAPHSVTGVGTGCDISIVL